MRNNERGIALVFVLFLVTTVSALAVSLIFLANSETYASGNYRLVTQARYGAESGLQKVSNFLLDPTQYNPATVAPGGAIDNTVSPVTWNGQPVVLNTTLALSHYPDAPTANAFALASTGTLPGGNNNAGMTFTGQATLLSEYTFSDKFTGNTGVAQTWQLTSDATIGAGGARTSTVEVSGMIETRKVPAINYGAFSTSPNCASMNFVGNVGTNSYNSGQAGLSGNAAPTFKNSGGDVGTNGNLTITGSVDVHGDLFSPNAGVGNCVNGTNVTALTEGGGATVSGNGGGDTPDTPKLLNKAVPFPTPSIPTPGTAGYPGLTLAPFSGINANSCNTLGLPANQCSVTGSTMTLTNTSMTPISLPEMSLGSHDVLLLQASTAPGVTNTFIMNSLTLGAQSTFQVVEPATAVEVDIKVTGVKADGVTQIGTPIDTTAGTVAAPNVAACGASPGCSTFNASFMEFLYAGTGELKMNGHADSAAVIYAPNAYVDFSGTSDLYGAIIANQIYGHGTFDIHYDTNLQNTGSTMSAPMMTAFSWKKY